MPPITETLLWYDYEAHSAEALSARPASFAAVRTDLDLNIIGEPINLLAKPASDFLPAPGALLVHRLPVRRLLRDGLCEVEFARAIYAEMTVPGTINVGYNTPRFDAKLTHALFYRNLLPMYDWQTNPNSRFDLHDLLRLAVAVQPDALAVPQRLDGSPSFRLEDLAQANGITHDAHDALSDVIATLELARSVKAAAPWLWSFSLNNRRKADTAKLLNPRAGEILLHASGFYGADKGYVAPILPVGFAAGDSGSVVALDLSRDPFAWSGASVEAVRAALFTPADELPEGAVRPPVIQIRTNANPALVPLSALSPVACQRLGIDVPACQALRQRLTTARPLVETLIAAYGREEDFAQGEDADDQVYGGFPNNFDRSLLESLCSYPTEGLPWRTMKFQEQRWQVLLTRCVLRNCPDSLPSDLLRLWDSKRLQFLRGELPRAGMTLPAFQEDMAQARARAVEGGDAEGLAMLAELDAYAVEIMTPRY